MENPARYAAPFPQHDHPRTRASLPGFNTELETPTELRRERDLYREQAAIFAEALIETGDAGADVVNALLNAQDKRRG